MSNISIVTLGVEDLVRSTKFYTDLGWINSTASQESVSFLIGHSIILGLYPHSLLAEDANISVTPIGFRGVTLAINKPSRESVDEFFGLAVELGGHSRKEPQEVFWGGYSGYFADPDGHLWEVAHNPFFEMNEHGQVSLTPKD